MVLLGSYCYSLKHRRKRLIFRQPYIAMKHSIGTCVGNAADPSMVENVPHRVCFACGRSAEPYNRVFDKAQRLASV